MIKFNKDIYASYILDETKEKIGFYSYLCGPFIDIGIYLRNNLGLKEIFKSGFICSY